MTRDREPALPKLGPMDSVLPLDHALPPNVGPPEAGISGLRHGGGPDAPPEVVLLARDTGLSDARLAGLVRHMSRGVPLVVTIPDACHPAPDGTPVPEAGALLEAVRASVPELAPRIIGKPEATLIEEALRRAGVTAGEALFIGDNPATDGAGAARAGLDFALVRAPTQEPTDDALDEARVTLLELLRDRHR